MTQAVNPYLPSWEYVPDGEPRVFDDRLYVFGSHDRFGESGYCLNDYVGWSAPVEDLADWRYAGVIYRKGQDPLNPKNKQNIYAPDLVRGPDGRYYLFYALHRETITSVAVAETPEGPFAFHGHVKTRSGRPYGSRRGELYNFDPGVLVDDDGRVFLYSGFTPDGPFLTALKLGGKILDAAYVVELEADMLTMKSGPQQVMPGPTLAAGTSFQEHAFFEAASPRNIRGKYYLVYSSIRSSELCYAISDRPDGGFEFGGTIVDIGDRGLNGSEDPQNYLGNTHGGLVEIRGQWFVFYHRHTNLTPYARQACAEPVEILPDGSIPQVEVTSSGINNGPLAGTGTYEARIACNLSNPGAKTFPAGPRARRAARHPYLTQSGTDRVGEGDQYIANLRDGTWAGYKHFTFTGGRRHASVSVRGRGSGVLEISTERGGEVVGRIPVESCGEWREETEWREHAGSFTAPSGVSALFFTFRGTGAIDFRSFTLI